MSNYNNLKTSIDANIKQNGNQEITGPILNSVLNQMVNILGTGYQFAGVATLTPATNPGTPDAKVFYIANGKGTYEKFGGLEVTEDDVVVLYWDTAWHKVSTGIASQEKLSELKEKVDALALGKFYGYFPNSSSLPTNVTTPGYAYVGLDNPYKIWNFNGESWSDSGTSIDMNDADEEDITRNADGKLQFKDRSYGDGMGYVILRKDKTFAEQVTNPNTIYEVRYDIEIGGTAQNPFVMPGNSVLKFNGGRLTDGFISGVNDIDAPGVCIFKNVSFVNSEAVFMIDWLVDSKSKVLTNSIDSTDDLRYAFNCGVTKIDLTSPNYFYISDTIEWNNNVQFIGINHTDAWGKNKANVSPCFHSDQAITMFKFNAIHSKEHVRSILKGFNIYNWHSITSAEETYDIPLFVVTNGNSSSNIWGLDMDVNILAVDKQTTKTINDAGDYVTMWYPAFIGVLLRAANGAYITYVTIGGNMSCVARCLKTESSGSGSWITDIHCLFDSERFVKVVEANGGEPLVVDGSHQPFGVIPVDDYASYPVIDIRNINQCHIGGKIWDLASNPTSYHIYNNGVDTGRIAKFGTHLYAVGSVTRCTLTGATGYTNYLPTGMTQNMPYGTEALRSHFPVTMQSIAAGSNLLGNLNENVAAAAQGFYFDARYQQSNVYEYIQSLQPSVESFVIKDENGIEYTDYELKLRGRSTRGIQALFETPKQLSVLSTSKSLAFGMNKNIWNNTDASHTFTISMSINVKYNYRNGMFLVIDNITSMSKIKAMLRVPNRNVSFLIADGSPDYWGGLVVSNLASLLVAESGESSITNYYIDVEITTDSISSKGRSILPYIALTLGNNVMTQNAGGDFVGRSVMHDLMFSQGATAVCYAPNDSFKSFTTTGDWQEVLSFSKLGSSDVSILYKDADGKILHIRCYSTSSVQCNAKDVLIKCETSTDNSQKFYQNGSVRQFKIYAKTLGANRTFFPDVISSNEPIEFLFNNDIAVGSTKEFGVATIGASQDKPTLAAADAGFVFFATDLEKPIYWTGTKWVDATGADV